MGGVLGRGISVTGFPNAHGPGEMGGGTERTITFHFVDGFQPRLPGPHPILHKTRTASESRKRTVTRPSAGY